MFFSEQAFHRNKPLVIFEDFIRTKSSFDRHTNKEFPELRNTGIFV